MNTKATERADTLREGDQILMPDDVTWATIERIWQEPGTGRLFLAHVEGGFSRKSPEAQVRTRRAS